MLQTILRLRNAIDYPLRQFFRWRRGGFVPRAGAKLDLFADLSPADQLDARNREARLFKQYHLAEFERVSSPGNYRENLFYVEMLEAALERGGAVLPDPLLAADIGPSHWFYIQGLAALLRWWNCPSGRSIQLEGFEADPYRVYADLRSRFDHAAGHLRGLDCAAYLPRAFTAQPGRFHLILMLFPFVFEKDHLEWGLPGSLFRPEALLSAAWDSLAPGGTLVIVNQGEAEHERQRERLLAAGITPAAAFRQDPLLYSYPYERFVLVARHGA